MKEHPILFSTRMVQAILEDRKNQTRRKNGLDKVNDNPGIYEYKGTLPDNSLKHVFARMWKGTWVETIHIKCPYGQPGDLLWVRETFIRINIDTEFEGSSIEFAYKASLGEAEKKYGHIKNGLNKKFIDSWKFKPSIHMPKPAARIWNEIEQVKVERVADISEEDAKAEGAKKAIQWMHTGEIEYLEEGHLAYDSALYRLGFKKLWNSINGKPKPQQSIENGKLITTGYTVYPFDEESAKSFAGKTKWRGKPLTVIINPWVWVVKFKVLSKTGKPSPNSAKDDSKPQICYKTGEICKYDCKGLCRESM